MSYQYDVFFSYKRNDGFDHWHEELKKMIAKWLEMELSQAEVRIFFDRREVEIGCSWRNELTEAMKRSKCLVSMYSPPYFRSKWCVTEWNTFHERGKSHGSSLIIPASVHDGMHFPGYATQLQYDSFNNYLSTLPIFWETEHAVRLDVKVKAFAERIARVIRSAPKYSEEFCVCEAEQSQVLSMPGFIRPADLTN